MTATETSRKAIPPPPRDSLDDGSLFLFASDRADEIAIRLLAGWRGQPKVLAAVRARAAALLDLPATEGGDA